MFGQTGAGKTHFMLEILRRRLIHPFPKNIYYMYNVEQPFMREHPEITFIKGLDFEKMDISQPSVLVIDDLIMESKNKEVGAAFIAGSHHHQISLFYITQNLFPKCDNFRLMSANCHYYVLFYNQRNFSQVHTLTRQIFVGNDRHRILNAYKRSGEQSRGFILLSFSPLLPHQLTVITDYWEICPTVYLTPNCKK